MKKFLRLSLVTAVMLTFTGAVLAQVISFDAGPNGNTYPSGINEEGRIVGSFYDENGMSFGFLQKKDGSFVLFNAGSIWTFFNAINSKGQIVGDLCCLRCRSWGNCRILAPARWHDDQS
jgi:uncharacterized membrane protein